MWRFIYYNERFVRIGRTSRAYIPKNADDAYDGKDQYVNDIKKGYFGDPEPIMERFTEDGVFSYNKPNKFDKKQ